MSPSDDDQLSEQEFHELLAKVPDMLRAQGLSEEEIAEGIAGLGDRLPQLRRMLADAWDYYRSDFVESLTRLAARQGSHFPDFDQLYRRKAELDQRAESSPPPDDSRM